MYPLIKIFQTQADLMYSIWNERDPSFQILKTQCPTPFSTCYSAVFQHVSQRHRSSGDTRKLAVPFPFSNTDQQKLLGSFVSGVHDGAVHHKGTCLPLTGAFRNANLPEWVRPEQFVAQRVSHVLMLGVDGKADFQTQEEGIDKIFHSQKPWLVWYCSVPHIIKD